jgi:hypothetical protein
MRRRSDKKDQIKGVISFIWGPFGPPASEGSFGPHIASGSSLPNQAPGCQKKDGEKEGEIENEGMEHLGDTSAQLPRAGDHFLDGIEGLPSKSCPTRSRPAGKSIKKLPRNWKHMAS